MGYQKRNKSQKRRQRGLIIKLSMLILHNSAVTALQMFSETGIRSAKAVSNIEIGANPNIFNIAIDGEGAPWIIPKDVQKSQRVHFRDKNDPSTTKNIKVDDMIFLSEKQVLYISSIVGSSGTGTQGLGYKKAAYLSEFWFTDNENKPSLSINSEKSSHSDLLDNSNGVYTLRTSPFHGDSNTKYIIALSSTIEVIKVNLREPQSISVTSASKSIDTVLMYDALFHKVKSPSSPKYYIYISAMYPHDGKMVYAISSMRTHFERLGTHQQPRERLY